MEAIKNNSWEILTSCYVEYNEKNSTLGMQKLLTLHLGRHAVLFLAENKRFAEFEFMTGNNLETSKVPLSVLLCIIEKNV